MAATLTGCHEFECRYVSGLVRHGEGQNALITIGEEVVQTDDSGRYVCPVFPYSELGNACIKCSGYEDVYMSVSELLEHPDVEPIKMKRDTRWAKLGEPLWVGYSKASADKRSTTYS